MEKKILVAVDSSIQSRQALQYVSQMSSVIPELSCTLVHIQPNVSLFLHDEAQTDPRADAELRRILRCNAEKSAEILEECRASLDGSGFDTRRIETISRRKKQDAARDILQLGQEGLYDAIVVGRRGLTLTQRFFMGSISTELLQLSRVIPVWVVDGEVSSRKILLAVDGSESSLRAVDHLSFMIGGNTDIRITLFHVVPRLRDYCEIDFSEDKSKVREIIRKGDRKCMDQFFSHARDKFREFGIGNDRVEIREASRIVNVGKAILGEARKGGFGTVVMGRRGVGKAFFMGSVSEYVLARSSNCALWLVS